MRIMVDTNVFISMIFFPNERMNTLKEKLCRQHRMVVCSYVVDEIMEVTRRKFPGKLRAMDAFFTELPFELVYAPSYYPRAELPELRDEKDEPILASAVMADVDILLTGDKDFSELQMERPEILTPNEFLERD